MFYFYLKFLLVLPCKSYIISCLDQGLSRFFLNWLIVDKFTTISGKLFHSTC